MASCRIENPLINGKRIDPRDTVKALEQLDINYSLDENITLIRGSLDVKGLTTEEVTKWYNENVEGKSVTNPIKIDEIDAATPELAKELADALNLADYRSVIEGKIEAYTDKSAIRELASLKTLVKASGNLSKEEVGSIVQRAKFVAKRGHSVYRLKELQKELTNVYTFTSDKPGSKPIKGKSKIDRKSLPAQSRDLMNLLASLEPDGLSLETSTAANEAIQAFIRPKTMNNAAVLNANTRAIKALIALQQEGYHVDKDLDESVSPLIIGSIVSKKLTPSKKAKSLSKSYMTKFNNFSIEDLETLSIKQLQTLNALAKKAKETGVLSSDLKNLIDLTHDKNIIERSISRDKQKMAELTHIVNEYEKVVKTVGAGVNPFNSINAIWDSLDKPSITRLELSTFFRVNSGVGARKSLHDKNSIGLMEGESNADNYFAENKNFRQLGWLPKTLFHYLANLDILGDSATRGLGYGILKTMSFFDFRTAKALAVFENDNKRNALVARMGKRKANGERLGSLRNLLDFSIVNIISSENAEQKTPLTWNMTRDNAIFELKKLKKAGSQDAMKYRDYIDNAIDKLKNSKTEEEYLNQIDDNIKISHKELSEWADNVDEFYHNAMIMSSKANNTKGNRGMAIPLMEADDTKDYNQISSQKVNDNLVDALKTGTFDEHLYETNSITNTKPGMVINPDSINTTMQSIQRKNIRAHTAASMDKLIGFLESKAYGDAVLDGKNNSLVLLRNAMMSYIADSTGFGAQGLGSPTYISKNNKGLRKFLRNASRIGAAYVLSSGKQPISQIVPVATDTLLITGFGSPKIMADVILKGNESDWVKALVNYGASSINRGQSSISMETQSESFESKMRNLSAGRGKGATKFNSALGRGGDKLGAAFDFAAEMAEDSLDFFVAVPDSAANIDGLVSFVKKWYSDNGKQWSDKEFLEGKAPKEAIDYAQHKVNMQQASADSAEGGALMTSQHGVALLLRSGPFAYQTFSNNARARLAHNFMLMNDGATNEIKWEAARNVSAFLAQQIVFQSVGVLVRALSTTLTMKIHGYDDEEIKTYLAEKFKRELKFSLQSILQDFTIIPGLHFYTPNIANKAINIFGYEDYFKDSDISREIGSLGALGNFLDLGKNVVSGGFNMAGYATNIDYVTGGINIREAPESERWRLALIGATKFTPLLHHRIPVDFNRSATFMDKDIFKASKKKNKGTSSSVTRKRQTKRNPNRNR